MTKTEARRKAKVVIGRGCFRPGKGNYPVPCTGSLVYNYCPLCNLKVEYDGYACDSIAKLQKGLCEALAEHMWEDH